MDEHADRAEVPFDETETGEVRLLDPARVRLFRTPEGVPRAVVADELCCLQVKVMCSFPLSRPGHYVSLRDGANREVGLIEDLRKLDRESRAIAEQEIDRRYFLPEITAVYQLESHFGTYDWHVETDRGPRSFLVRGRSENIVHMPPHRVIVTDVLGNRYQVSDATRLDRRSAALLYKIL
ncbi:MAG: DUF1854 domain-containing protein [Candidatus Brocadiia bacterium]